MDAPPPPMPRDQLKVDSDQINLLAIFHFVGAGLAIVGMLFLIAHYSFMHLFFANPKMWESQKGGPPPAEFFAIFKWFYLFFGLWLLVSFVLNLLSGLFMKRRKNRTFSLVVAGINCVHMPLGTILGIFTIMVLIRESVRQTYEA